MMITVADGMRPRERPMPLPEEGTNETKYQGLPFGMSNI